MSAEIILNSIGYIDEELVTSCDELRRNYNPKKFRYGKWISVAACLLIVSVIGLAFMLRPDDTAHIKLSGISWWHYKNPIIYTERPEREQVAVAPTETPISTIEPTMTPAPTAIPEVEVTSEPTEEPVNWIQYIAGLSSERGAGASFSPGTSADTTDEAVVIPDSGFIGWAGNWSYELIFNGGLYKARNSTLTAQDIGESLGDYTLSGYESITDTYFSDNISVYAINNVSTDAAVAICIGQERYYVFVNAYYVPDSLSDFFDDFNFINTTQLGELVTFNETDGSVSGKYNIQNSSAIWNTLLKNEAYMIDYSALEESSDINISMSNELYRFYSVSFALYNEGYIYFNVLNQRMAFFIGEDAVNDIRNLIVDGSGSITEISSEDRPFGVAVYDPETGETTYQYYDIDNN